MAQKRKIKPLYHRIKDVCEAKGFSTIDGHVYENADIKHPIRCRCGNVWDITIYNLRTCKGCPKCKASSHKQRVKEGLVSRINAAEFSERLSAKRQDVMLVGEYTCASEKTLFKCSVCGHHWLARPHHIMSGSRCPECHKRWYDDAKIDSKLTGKYENIIRLSNSVYGQSVDFYCKVCSRKFTDRPSSFFAKKAKYVCPYCSEENGGSGGFDKTAEASLYFATVVVNGLILYKVGITNGDPEKRLSDIAEKFIVYRTLRLHGTHVANMEAYIKAKFKHLRAFKNGDVVDCKSGYTEMYTDDIPKMLTKEELILAAKGLTSVQQNVKETQEVVK